VNIIIFCIDCVAGIKRRCKWWNRSFIAKVILQFFITIYHVQCVYCNCTYA